MKTPLYGQKKWYRLDKSADLYPMSTTMTTMSIFRVSAEMKEYVDGAKLEAALKAIMPRFPTYAVMLRRGLFRYYFDTNELPPKVSEDNGILFEKIDFVKNNHYLFKVQYFNKRISIDFFHGLSDATGATEFLKALVYRYLAECGNELPEPDGIKVVGEEISEGELEDSIAKYYTKYKLLGGVVGKMAGKNCFGITGKRFKHRGYGLIHGYVKADELIGLARSMDCTVTVLITAITLLSICKVYCKGKRDNKLVAMIPVNLRKIFPSDTMRNFTTLTKCIVDPVTTPRELKEYVDICKEQLREGLADKKLMAEKISVSAFYAANPFMRVLPAVFKEFITKFGKAITHKTKQTIIISNLGVVKLPKGMERDVHRFTFNINISKKVPVNMGIVTYNGITAISFTRMLIDTKLEREFFTTLGELGIRAEISSNLRENAKK